MTRTVLAVFLFAVTAQAQEGPEAVRQSYTKYELEIPMRDGVKLFTTVYVPKDTSQSYPILLNRTPYSVRPYGVDHYRAAIGPSEHFQQSGYIIAYQDVRGRYMSEGRWEEMRPHIAEKSGAKDVDESTDTWDTVEWLTQNIPGNNGKVGMWGISYPGFYASAGMIDAHPALVAVSPQAPVTDLYLGDDAYHNGAFMLAANFRFYTFFYPWYSFGLNSREAVLPSQGSRRREECQLSKPGMSATRKCRCWKHRIAFLRSAFQVSEHSDFIFPAGSSPERSLGCQLYIRTEFSEFLSPLYRRPEPA